MSELAKTSEKSAPPVQVICLKETIARNGIPKKADQRDVRLDSDIEALLIAISDIGRLEAKIIKNISRKRQITERGLTILSIVNAGLNRPSMLIDYFDVLPSTITVETEKLVAAGYLVRRQSPSDRRVTELALTDLGRQIRVENINQFNATFRPRLKNVSTDDLRTVVKTLRAIIGPLEPATPRR